MNMDVGEIFIETALDVMIEEAAEEFEDIELDNNDMGDIIDFINQTESEE